MSLQRLLRSNSSITHLNLNSNGLQDSGLRGKSAPTQLTLVFLGLFRRIVCGVLDQWPGRLAAGQK